MKGTTTRGGGSRPYQCESRTAADFPAKVKLVQRITGLTHAKILDVGCGKGHFVQALCDAGYDAFGIDLSKKAVEIAASGGLACRAGDIQCQSDWRNMFDVVTSFATMEHVPRPNQFLADIRRVLKPAGYLFVDTGLGGDWLDDVSPGYCQWYDAPQHIFVFSKKGLTNLLERAGFNTVSVDTFFERTVARRVAKLARNGLLSLVLTVMCRFALGNAAFTKLRREAKLPWGSLLMVVARKPRQVAACTSTYFPRSRSG